MQNPLYRSRVVRALELAATWHAGQFRKHPSKDIPYITHPAGVGFILMRAGADDDVVAAGILHDVVEDCGITEDALADAMGRRVADLVMAVTELPKPASWATRKTAYAKKLHTAPPEALMIAAADHLYNIKSITAVAKTGVDPWNVFHASPKKKIEHEEKVFRAISERSSGPLVDELREAIEELKKHVPPS